MSNKQMLNCYNYITILLASFPLLGLNLTSILIIIWSVFSLFVALKTKQKFTKNDIFNIALLSIVFFSYLITFCFVEDKKTATKLIEKGLPFLVFPLFITLNKNILKSKILEQLLNVFVVSNFILAVYAWIRVFQEGFLELLKNNNFYNPIFRNIFYDETNIHLPYLGLLFAFSIFILVVKLTQNQTTKKYILYCLVLIILLISIMLFAARMALFSLLISICIFILLKWNSSFYKKTILIGALFSCGLLITRVEPFKSRINDIYSSEYILPHEGQTPEEVNIRYGIYHCVKQITDKHWLTGVGATNVQKELNNCYSQYTYKGEDDYKHIDYNSHNQYFDILLKYGIFGLVLFIISILWGIRSNNYYYLGFIILFTLSLITENMLSRQVGIVFFTLFNSIFFINKKNFEKDNRN